MKVEDYITKHEGMVLRPYKDTVGKETIGVGHNLTDNGISRTVALFMLKEDIKNAQYDLMEVFGEEFEKLPDNVQIALTDMMFNMGISRFEGFKKMIAAIKAKDFKTAAKEAKASHWCLQVGKRCQDNYELLYNS